VLSKERVNQRPCVLDLWISTRRISLSVIFSGVERRVDGNRRRGNRSVVIGPKLFGNADGPKGIHDRVCYLKIYFIGRVSRRYYIGELIKKIRGAPSRLNSGILQQRIWDASILCSFEKPRIS